jgi:hypothetical protein
LQLSIIQEIQLIQSPIHSPPTHLSLLPEPETLNISDDDIVFVEAVAAPFREDRRRRRSGIQLRPRIIFPVDEEYFVEKVVGWMVVRGREFYLIKWSGYGEEDNTWEDGAEKRREIPDMIADYFNELGLEDEQDNSEDNYDLTDINQRKRRRFL